jgi:hypothetical protein
MKIDRSTRARTTRARRLRHSELAGANGAFRAQATLLRRAGTGGTDRKQRLQRRGACPPCYSPTKSGAAHALVVLCLSVCLSVCWCVRACAYARTCVRMRCAARARACRVVSAYACVNMHVRVRAYVACVFVLYVCACVGVHAVRHARASCVVHARGAFERAVSSVRLRACAKGTRGHVPRPAVRWGCSSLVAAHRMIQSHVSNNRSHKAVLVLHRPSNTVPTQSHQPPVRCVCLRLLCAAWLGHSAPRHARTCDALAE